MQFFLATPDDIKKSLSNVNRIKIHLTTGLVEILDKHQDLLGQIRTDLVEVENNDENKIEKLKFVVQDAVVIVSNKSLNNDDIVSQTGIYIYTKRVLELTSNLSLEEFSKKVEQNSIKLENEKQILNDTNITLTNLKKTKTKIFLLEDDIEFDKKVLSFLKDLKN
jgi:F0F1-type ATP synthase epsilon subunit